MCMFIIIINVVSVRFLHLDSLADSRHPIAGGRGGSNDGVGHAGPRRGVLDGAAGVGGPRRGRGR